MSRDPDEQRPRAPADAPTRYAPVGGHTETMTDAGQPRRGSTPPPRVALDVDLQGPPEGPRYEERGVIGRGGMGEVRLARDRRIGREVALKVALQSVQATPDARRRFLREARVQAQLDHPSVVPVHELEWLSDGTAYFTMKRVRGVTLARVVELLAAGDEEARRRYPLRRLLSAFNTACLTADFAHSRGVLHRDLKPSNLMLGDFGEVYVLDWGIAKLLDHDPDDDGGERLPLHDEAAETNDGVMGTLGYMPPEQLDRPASELRPSADVYALGAILFELLVHEPVLLPAHNSSLVARTRAGVDADASRRLHEAKAPAALEAICVRALARDPRDRFPSARALHDAVDAFLSGSEEAARRRELSERLVHTAAEALEASLVAEDGGEDLRGRATRDLTQALALAPDNDDAKRQLVRLLTEAPRQVPAEVKASLARDADRFVRLGARRNVFMSAAWLPFVALGLWMGVLDVTLLLLVTAGLIGSYLLTAAVARQARPSFAIQHLAIAANTFAYMTISRVFGPFLVVPALLAVYGVVLQTHPRRAMRRASLAWCSAGAALPFLLELVGVLPSSQTFVEGGMLIREQMLAFEPVPALIMLFCGGLAVTIGPALYVAGMRTALDDAERRLHLQAWQLERMLPKSAAAQRRDDNAETTAPR